MLAAALLVVATFQSRAANLQTEAENRRTGSLLLADQLRQRSNLTTTVRLYGASAGGEGPGHSAR